jgi:integrase
MTTGNITRRGERSWRLKYEAGDRDPVTGKRRTRFETVRGTRKDAQRRLTKVLAAVDKGIAVDPSRMTVAEYIRGSLDSETRISPKTLERYRQLAEGQVIPYLGKHQLQQLRPIHIEDWHAALLRGTGSAKPLSPTTVSNAHRFLHRALKRALRLEMIGRNVAHVVRPPKASPTEMPILDADKIGQVLAALDGHPLHPIVGLALGTGMRRGELCALAWGAVDLEKATVSIERSLEETASGLRFKSTKTGAGRRSVSLPPFAVEILRQHQRRQAEQRLLLGLGRAGPGELVFTLPDGSPFPPDKLSRDWWRIVTATGGCNIPFHALRHSHASALIAAGLDVVTVAKRLGHTSPAITLGTYAHQFRNNDAAAAQAIEVAMSGKGDR